MFNNDGMTKREMIFLARFNAKIAKEVSEAIASDAELFIEGSTEDDLQANVERMVDVWILEGENTPVADGDSEVTGPEALLDLTVKQILAYGMIPRETMTEVVYKMLLEFNKQETKQGRNWFGKGKK